MAAKLESEKNEITSASVLNPGCHLVAPQIFGSMLRCAGLIRSWRTATAGRKNGGEESKPLDETLRLTSYSLSNQKHTHKGADDNHETKNICAKKYFNLTNKTVLFICEGTVNTFTLILKFIITI